jgi:tRNA modification GTPase
MGFSVADTIVAIATPPGRGGIGVVRLAGADAARIACQLTGRATLKPRHATLTRVVLPQVADEAVLTFFPSPHSYTGDDVVEVSAHGSPVMLRAIVRAAVSAGARPAEPGEFTLRAFLNGRLDLTQAEAVADLIDAVTPLQARAAFDQLQGTVTRAVGEIDGALLDAIMRLEASIDFPEEGYHFVEPGALVEVLGSLAGRTRALLREANRGRLVREGLQVAIVGRPNVGKSSLFNALLRTERAIVNGSPGTTRDLVSETLDLEGFAVTLVDTAGIRETSEAVETEGVARARAAAEVADLVLHVVDRSCPDGAADFESIQHAVDKKALVVENKIDLPSAWPGRGGVTVSATTGAGLDALRRAIIDGLGGESLAPADPPALTNLRHVRLVERAHDAICRALEAVGSAGGALSEEFVLVDLHQARAALEEITGRRSSEDLLAGIFSRFCIGK